jgi:nucleotide-binding universal stress UspA family protein
MEQIMIYERILVAVDGSETSKKALIEAVRIAGELKSSLRILGVYDNPDNYNEYYLALNDLVKLAQDSQVNYDSKITGLEGGDRRIADQIIAEVKAFNADLLVMGTHGRTGLSHLLLGSVAQSAVRMSTIPVLLINGA